MKHSDDYLLGIYAHSNGAAKLISLASGALPFNHDNRFSVELLRDDDGNCAIFVVAVQSEEILRRESFEWGGKKDTTNRLFALCNYIDSAAWAAMDNKDSVYWNLRELDALTIIDVLEIGYREIGENFNPGDWRQKWSPKGKSREPKKT